MKKFLVILINVSFLLYIPIVLFSQGTETTGVYIPEEEKKFTISGFMDMNVINVQFDDADKNPMEYRLGKDKHTFFTQNNLNLYFNFLVDKDWKAFAEIKFMYSPTGNYNQSGLSFTPENTETTNSLMVSKDYGSIYIERAYIEWNHFYYATIRAGKFLTPFGIWSQDHGSPTLTSIRAPILVTPFGTGMPISQTGLELLGKINVSDLTIEYATYIGNGKNNSQNTSDNSDDNKSFGGFLNLILPTIADRFDIELGASGYRGENSKYSDFTIGMDGTLESENYETKQMETFAIAHLKLSIGQLPLDSEFIIQVEAERMWIKEDEVKTPQGNDYTLDDFYVQTELRLFGFIGPYYRYELLKANDDYAIMNSIDKIQFHVLGINYKPIPKVSIKLEYFTVKADILDTPAMAALGYNLDSSLIMAQIAMAF